MNPVIRSFTPRPSPSCDARAAVACCRAASGRASEAPRVAVDVRVFPVSRVRREVPS